MPFTYSLVKTENPEKVLELAMFVPFTRSSNPFPFTVTLILVPSTLLLLANHAMVSTPMSTTKEAAKSSTRLYVIFFRSRRRASRLFFSSSFSLFPMLILRCFRRDIRNVHRFQACFFLSQMVRVITLYIGIFYKKIHFYSYNFTPICHFRQ